MINVLRRFTDSEISKREIYKQNYREIRRNVYTSLYNKKKFWPVCTFQSFTIKY